MTLHEYGEFYNSDKATHHHFCGFYQAHLNQPKVILEFGILNGGSLKMWRDFYEPALVIGLDIEEKPPVEGCLIFKRDAVDTDTVQMLTTFVKNFDVIIDDASHNTNDQIMAFEMWWPYVNEGGRYIIEDIHASFFDHYNPNKIDLEQWVKDTGIEHKFYWKDPAVKNDSGTVMFFK